MKNRKIVLVAFLLLSAVILSVGYAAITHSLKVENYINLNYDKGNYVVDFKEVEVTQIISDETPVADLSTYLGANTVQSAVASSNSSVITLTSKVGVLKAVGDKIVFECTIQNLSEDYDSLIKTSNITTAYTTNVPANSEDKIENYVTVSYELAGGNSEVELESADEQGNETVVTITILLETLPIQAMEGTVTITINTEASPKD